MRIAFFITKTGDFYADIGATTLDEKTFRWLSGNAIELGRKSSFAISKETPVFNSTSEAAHWLSKHWFPKSRFHGDRNTNDVSSDEKPTIEQYEDCARLAHEINEFAAMGMLAEILPYENDHSYLCQLGVWYWSLGHRELAVMAYERSISIRPEAPTYFNLAVCNDDMGNKDLAEASMEGFYQRVSSDEERVQAEAMLNQQGKSHLIIGGR